MADYLLMIWEDERAHALQAPQAMAKLIADRTRFATTLRDRGQLVDAGRLRPSKDGQRVRRLGDALQVECGPFIERGKALAAYYWVHATSAEQAAEIGGACPTLASDHIDVRPVMKGQIEAEKARRAGKLFACVVRGKGATGAEWVQVMDRIDRETSLSFPADSFVGGVRLHPPSTEPRQGASRGERQATFDGPFLECKEVVGGVFVMRMNRIEDAVRWASETRFVVHGTLEIRELWRS